MSGEIFPLLFSEEKIRTRVPWLIISSEQWKEGKGEMHGIGFETLD
jgi:hypothetical protein